MVVFPSVGDHAIGGDDHELVVGAFGSDEFIGFERRKRRFENVDLDVNSGAKFEDGHSVVRSLDQGIQNRDFGFIAGTILPLRSHAYIYYRVAINVSPSRGAFMDKA